MTNWIKYTERKPEKTGRYLVVEKHFGGRWVGVAAFRNNDFCFKVTYWQELPLPPED